MEAMDVEVSIPLAEANNEVFICCITKKYGLKKAKIPLENFSGLSLVGLKDVVLRELNSWEWVDDNDKPKGIDILHCSRILKSDEDVKRVGPLSVVTVIKKNVTKSENEEDHRSAKFIADYAAKNNVNDRLTSCSLALRTAFLNPKFVTMIEGLKDMDKLESIFAIVPELRNDQVAIGIIQDQTQIFHLHFPEALKKVATTKPWLIQAFEYIAASIHQERDSTPQGIPGHLFNPAMFDDDESMEEGDDDEGGAGGRAAPAITREHLAAALSALGGGSGGAGGLSGSNAFGGLFQPPRPSATPQQQQQANPRNPVATAGANIQNLMNTLAGASGGAPGQSLNSDTVARAVTEALRRLTPEQRADQMNAIRNFATQLPQPSATAVPSPPPTQTTPAPLQPQDNSSSSLSQQFASQLRQMREMGITDERLSILALRVSEGDVNTAVELIFSGWQGEGSDPTN